jgi:hypothetical protein
MERHKLTNSEMAQRLRSSRPAVDRLLDPTNLSSTLSTIERAAAAAGERLMSNILALIFSVAA